MTERAQEHRWVVDGIEEGMARVEADGEQVMVVPLWLLPAGVAEGQVLHVVRSEGSGSATLTITIDHSATSAALARSRAQVAKTAAESKRRDGGGDVAL